MTRHAHVAERPLSALDVIYGRRSVRAYAPQTLDRSTVRGLLDAAVQAPSAMHAQPWLFVVVQDHHMLRRLSDDVKAGWAGKAIADVPGNALRRQDLHGEFIARLREPAFNVFYDAGTLIVICARRLDPFVTADCWLAAENLMLAATALGLGTCCIGAAVDTLNTPHVKAMLRMPADVHAVAPVVVGVPAGSTEPATRADPEIVSWT
jgi:nitroreductase